jgi:aminopeptidase N
MQISVLTRVFTSLSFGFLLMACAGNKKNMETNSKTISSDPHSWAGHSSARVVSEHLEMQVDFEKKCIRGEAELEIQNHDDADSVFIDTRNLKILSVEDADGRAALPYSLTLEQPFIGRGLKVEITGRQSLKVMIRYETGSGADALQWLDPQLTAGGKMPLLFTQGQAILSRTWFPCQDSPGIRFRWTANVQVPDGMRAVMSADKQSETSKGNFHFEMSQPVPAYLVALAVGNLSFKAIDERTGVFAEPEMLDRSVWEFADMGKMLKAAENLYGAYRWGRYDVLVLPPSFPFGGMENPCVTFATPTILAGDRSLVSLVAHELAHSWSGNLVTNANWDDFWLNEGFTVYFERRIMESLEGKDYADMLAVIGWQDLQATLADLGPDSPDSKLKLNLKGRDADEGMSDIAYEKGYRFLCSIEAKVGRAKWDSFLKKYFDDHAFSTITTENFLEYLDTNLLKPNGIKQDDLNVKTWVYSTGLPKDLKAPVSLRFENAGKLAESCGKGEIPEYEQVKSWSSHEWLFFLRNLPEGLKIETMEKLDKKFSLTKSRNSEILFEWLMLSVSHKYLSAYEALEYFLEHTGRRKFVLPLYRELVKTVEGRDLANRIFAKAANSYHSVTRGSVESVLNIPNKN